MTPKLSHLKQLLSPGSGGWVGLGDFLMSGQGVGQSWGSCHLSMSGRSAGAVGQNTCMWLPPGLGSSQHGTGFKHECPQDTRQRLSGFLWPTPRSSEIASVMLKPQACTDLRKESQCHVFTRICVKYCGHLGKYTDFLYHFMKSVLIFLGYINLPLDGSCLYFLSILVSDLHSSFILWGINTAAINNIIVISYVFQVFL